MNAQEKFKSATPQAELNTVERSASRWNTDGDTPYINITSHGAQHASTETLRGSLTFKICFTLRLPFDTLDHHAFYLGHRGTLCN